MVQPIHPFAGNAQNYGEIQDRFHQFQDPFLADGPRFSQTREMEDRIEQIEVQIHHIEDQNHAPLGRFQQMDLCFQDIAGQFQEIEDHFQEKEGERDRRLRTAAGLGQATHHPDLHLYPWGPFARLRIRPAGEF